MASGGAQALELMGLAILLDIVHVFRRCRHFEGVLSVNWSDEIGATECGMESRPEDHERDNDEA